MYRRATTNRCLQCIVTVYQKILMSIRKAGMKFVGMERMSGNQNDGNRMQLHPERSKESIDPKRTKVLKLKFLQEVIHNLIDFEENCNRYRLREPFKQASPSIKLLEYVQSCIHCIIEKTDIRIPRLLAKDLPGRRHNEIVYIYSLYIKISDMKDLRKGPIIKDGSRRCGLVCPGLRADGDIA